MSKKLLTLTAILAGIGLFAGGIFFSQVNAQINQQGWMMGNSNGQADANMMGNGQFGSGMMGDGQYGGMMGMMMSGGNFGMMDGMMNGQYGSGMMGEGQYEGMMSGNMMGNFGYVADAEINFTAEKAVNAAQEYLDAYLPGKIAEEHADSFPGYYTLHILEDSEVVGMISVNTYTGQVFLHHWHGDFIEMTGEEHD